MENKILIVSDLHHRISGVSASLRSLLPLLKKSFDLIFLAKQPHGDIQAQSLFDVIRQLWRLDRSLKPIWHVRRNNEMIWGLLVRRLINRRLKLVFTSAAIRRHSALPRYLISRMDAVIATSRKAADLVPNVRAIVPHGIDIERFTAVHKKVDYPWSRYKTSLGIVGRVRPEKGTDLFSKSICELLLTHTDACAVIVGKTTAKYQAFLKDLKKDWQRAGIEHRVFVVDEVALKDMPAIYQSLDIVCAPARYEGFGLVPLEAMVSGTAIVATNTGAYADMILPDKNGILIDCDNQLQLTVALRELLDNPEKVTRFKAEGKKVVSQRFSLHAEVEGIVRVYNSLWSVS